MAVFLLRKVENAVSTTVCMLPSYSKKNPNCNSLMSTAILFKTRAWFVFGSFTLWLRYCKWQFSSISHFHRVKQVRLEKLNELNCYPQLFWFNSGTQVKIKLFVPIFIRHCLTTSVSQTGLQIVFSRVHMTVSILGHSSWKYWINCFWVIIDVFLY